MGRSIRFPTVPDVPSRGRYTPFACPRRSTDDRLFMTNERLLTTAEVAASLRVSRQSVTRWIRDRQLGAITIKVSGRTTYRVPESRFREFLQRYVEGLD